MTRSHEVAGGRPRSLLIVLLLFLVLVLVAVLAGQAQDAVRSHRAMAEKVLRGYAALAADEFARRATAEIGLYGYYAAITAIREAGVGTGNGPLPTPADLAAGASDDARRGLALARTLFRFDPAGGRLETSGPELGPDVAAWLRGALTERGGRPLPEGRRYEARYAEIGGTFAGFVTVPLGGTEVGFVVERAALEPAVRKALDRGPLLPPSLGGDELGKEAVQLSLADPFGAAIFRYGPPVDPSLCTEKKLGADRNGILDGFVLRAGIDPAAAPKLAIGGLPRSRLPVLLALMAVAAGLMLTAVLQLRREHALGRMRSDFVSRVSHELRTPLTQIRMFAETLLLDRVRSDEERVRSVAIIDREARRLSNLVENVLRFSRAEKGEVRLAPRTHDVGPVVLDLLDEFRPLAEGRGASLAARVPDRAVASVDDDALRQVLLNLLDNAVKYGPEGQEVRVGVSAAPEGVRVWVDDEGPGIPAAERERVWRGFFRLATHRESAVAGTGIGLAVVRDLVALHGGRSWVEPGERGGARFVVEFPVAARIGARP